MTQTNPSTYCPSRPRAILCIARNDEALPLATCVICTQVIELKKSKFSGFTRYLETDPQGPVPDKRTVCPRNWIVFDLSYYQEQPFTCRKCRSRNFQYDGSSFWGYGKWRGSE